MRFDTRRTEVTGKLIWLVTAFVVGQLFLGCGGATAPTSQQQSGDPLSKNTNVDENGKSMLEPTPPPSGKSDSVVGKKGIPVSADNARTAVWDVKRAWNETNPSAGIAWSRNSGLTWNEKYRKWVDSMDVVDAVSGGKTFELQTPYDKSLEAPSLECAEVAMFLRVAFAAWYDLPFFMVAKDRHGRRLFFGHFGIRTMQGAWDNAPAFKSRYSDYSHLADEIKSGSENWPSDSQLAGLGLPGADDDGQPMLDGSAESGAYFDEVFLNKRVGYFLRYMLVYFGSMNVSDPRNTFHLKADAIKPGDVATKRPDWSGIGHTVIVKKSKPISNAEYDTKSFEYSNTRTQSIPDDSDQKLVSEITVPKKGEIKTLKIDMDITHPYRGDLWVRLRKKGQPGKSTTLYRVESGFWSNFYWKDDLEFDAKNISAFQGDQMKGTWQLVVVDEEQEDSGKLHNWALNFKSKVQTASEETGGLEVQTVSGSMPRRQPKLDSPAGAKRKLTGDKWGGPGYAKYQGGLHRWRQAENVEGQWTNVVPRADRDKDIRSWKHDRLAERTERFKQILGQLSPRDRMEALAGVIESKREHLRQMPASCAAREAREKAFDDLYEVGRELGMSKVEVDQEYRKFEDYVLAELKYDQSKTCCWLSATPAMYDLIIEYNMNRVMDNNRLQCRNIAVFKARDDSEDGYEIFRSYAESVGQGDKWVDWSAGESCPQSDVAKDTEADHSWTPMCEVAENLMSEYGN